MDDTDRHSDGTALISLQRIIDCILQELHGARDKFPFPNDTFAALAEEQGELAKALLEHKYKNCNHIAVYAEAVQVAAMAIRVALEGDLAFPYKYNYDCYRFFSPTKGKSETTKEGYNDTVS